MQAPSKTALFDSTKLWDAAAVKAMLKAAPELLRAPDQKGRTALHIACAVKPASGKLDESNGIRTVTTLLDAGADPTIKDAQGRDAIEIARARRLPKEIIERMTDLKERRRSK
jgi:ankyrin repeat protein